MNMPWFWGSDFVQACRVGDIALAKHIDRSRHVPMIEKEMGFMVAGYNVRLDMMRWLVKVAGVEVDFGDGAALCRSCDLGQVAVVKFLVELGADVGRRGTNRPFHIARQAGREELAVWLVLNCPLRFNWAELHVQDMARAGLFHLLAVLADAGHCRLPGAIADHPAVRWHRNPTRATWIGAVVV